MEKPVSRDLKWLNSITWQVRGKPGQDPDPRLPPLPFYRSSLLSSLLILFCHLKKPNPQGFSEAHEGLWVGLDWGNEKGRGLGGNEKQGQATFYDAPFCLWAPNPVCGVCLLCGEEDAKKHCFKQHDEFSLQHHHPLKSVPACWFLFSHTLWCSPSQL